MKAHKAPKGGSPKPSKGSKNGPNTGIITVIAKGVGYVPAEGFDQDIEIPPHFLNTALHGDTVTFHILPRRHGHRVEGEVDKVLERAKTRFAGVLIKENSTWILKPDHKRMYRDIEIADAKNLNIGDKVIVRLLPWSDPEKRPRGTVEEVLGKAGTHDVEMRAIVAERGFDTGFPPEVEKAAEELRKQNASYLAEEAKKRKDFRNTVTFTIDPHDAKDFDDAISVKKLSDGFFEIGVHIADVSAYVEKGNVIDKEALKRGTSIYLVDRTIPMLPEALSNDLCSLNPQTDKLAFSAVIEINAKGQERSRWFGRTLINSNKRFTYEEAQKILDGGDGPCKEELFIARDVARALRDERFRKGAIAFETDEVKFRLDENGVPISVYVKERQETNLLIEDLMLHANKAVAEYVTERCKEDAAGKCVFVYRIHDSPKPERIADLALFLKAIGHELKGGENGTVSAKDINALFKQIVGTPEQSLIETATIRSMAKAVYSLKNIGHFGLAFKHYTHFTSPIRRYPDLMVHRMLQAHLDGSPISSREYGLYEKLAMQCTEREIAAAEAERDSIKYKQVEFMMGKIGQVFDGTVSGVTEWGIYVEEKESKAEGMVRLRALSDDWYQFDPKRYALVGEKSKKTFALGDKVRVRLVGANLEQKTLDWELVA